MWDNLILLIFYVKKVVFLIDLMVGLPKRYNNSVFNIK